MATSEELMRIGEKLVSLNNDGKAWDCIEQLCTSDLISVEAFAMPGKESAETQGLEAIKAKHEWWDTHHEIHHSKAHGPFIHGTDRFCVIFDIDVTNKDSNQRMQFCEIATYYVNENGKIDREEFAYAL